MKILFSEFVTDILFNTGIAALTAYLKKAGYEISLIQVVDEFNRNDYEEKLQSIQPDLIAFSSMSFQWNMTQQMLRSAKRVLPEVPTIVGGCHPTFCPEEVLSCPYVDFICCGEGELALSLFADALEKRNADLYTIPGIWSKKGGAITRNAFGPLIRDLDTLPFWEREIFNYEQLLEAGSRVTSARRPYVVSLSTIRGCPWNCSYCSNAGYQRIYKNHAPYHRERSVSHVLNELRQLRARSHIEEIEFWDEAFGLHIKWLAEFSRAYKAEFSIPFTVLIRPEQTRNEMFLKLLAGCGCIRVMIGVEVGNEAYRKRILRRDISNKDVIEAVCRCHEHDIEVLSLNMIGLPYETPELMRQTIEFNRQLEPDFVYLFVFQPYPGTQLYELCKEQGWLPDDAPTPYWPLSPQAALAQPSYTREEFLQIYQEFTAFQKELAGKAASKRAEKIFERLQRSAVADKLEKR